MTCSIPYIATTTPCSTASTPSQSTRFSCQDCGRSYKAVETLNRHRKNHSSVICYSCAFCPAAFKRKDLLDRHVQIHEGGRSVLTSSRGSRACARCARLKTKCDRDGAKPCTRCSKGGYACLCREEHGPRRRERKRVALQDFRLSEAMSEMDVSESSPGMLLDERLVRAASLPEDFAHSDSLSWTVGAQSWEHANAWQWADIADLQLDVAQDGVCHDTIPPGVSASFDPAWTMSFDQNTMPASLPAFDSFDSASDLNMDCCSDLSWCDCPPAASWDDGTLWMPDCLPPDMAAFTSLYQEPRLTARASL